MSVVFCVFMQGTVYVRVACLSVPSVCGLYSDVLHSTPSCVGACSHAVRVMSYSGACCGSC